MSYKVKNDDLREELEKYRKSCTFKEVMTMKGHWRTRIDKRGKISDELAKMIMTISEGLSRKGNWKGYTWREDFVQAGILTTLKYMHNYNSDVNSNAHGYINRICYNCFLQYIQKEKRLSDVKKKVYDKKDELNNDGGAINYKTLLDFE